MKYIPQGKIQNIQCSEVLLPEFPEIKFGSLNGIWYFDAYAFASSKQKPNAVSDFLSSCEKIIDSLLIPYNMQPKTVSVINQDGHILIEGHFVYLIISFVEPYFLAYLLDRVNELFANGIAVSDSYIATLASQRLSKEMLIEMANGQTGA